MSSERVSSPQRTATSPLAQVSVEAVTPQVVAELAAAVRAELASFLPGLLAPLLQELKNLKNQIALEREQAREQIPQSPKARFSLDLPPPERLSRRESRSFNPSAYLPGEPERPPVVIQGAAAGSAAWAPEEADEPTTAVARISAGALEDIALASPTLDSLPTRMEIEMSTPLVDPFAQPRQPSLRWSWRTLSPQRVSSARESYRLTPRRESEVEQPVYNSMGSSRTSLYPGRTSIKEMAEQLQERKKSARDGVQAGIVEQSWAVKNVTAFLEDPDSSCAAWYYSQFMIAFSIFAILVGLLPYVGLSIPLFLEVVIDSMLCLEIVVRALFCPNLSAFVSNYSNLIDSLSAVPLSVIFLMSVGWMEREGGSAFLLSAVPVIRFLRFVRRFQKMQILITAFKDCLEALPVLLYTLAVMGCIFTSAIFLAEPRDNIGSLSECAWLVIATISTVGYGDITPCTKVGAALASILMVVSQLYMAMPFGIIGYNFTVIWEHRSQILLLNATRDRLAKMGFGAYEIPHLFELFDVDESGEFDMEEFIMLFKEMDIGFKEEDIYELFKLIDKDSGGTIDEKEFVKVVFPDEYRNMYGRSKKPEKVKDLLDLLSSDVECK